jgi:cytosine/adenosine deaminase-related metal-dependent hydrolase
MSGMADLLITGGTVLTVGPAGVVEGAVYVVDGRIAELPSDRRRAATVIDATGRLVLPGFVQAHIHLCQTLFRGLADDMDVVQWLRERIWPLEQAHDEASLRASAELGVAELLLGGTTSILSMETTRHTHASFEAAAALGIRARIGPALMDRREPGTEMIGMTTEDSVRELTDLLGPWHGAAGGRLGVAASPRGPRNATPELWAACIALSTEHGLVLHTHVNENKEQAELLARGPDGRDVYALERYGALGPSLVMAHGVWLDTGERDLVRERGAHICHCPSSNLKLASGIAPIPDYLDAGINVALGADGAPCSNTLSAMGEMRLAGLLHKPRFGSRAMPAGRVLEMATMGGARALGLAAEIGSVEPGKRADLVVIGRERAHSRPMTGGDLAGAVVYSSRDEDVTDVVVDGRHVVGGGELLTASMSRIAAAAERERVAVLTRSGLRGSGLVQPLLPGQDQ